MTDWYGAIYKHVGKDGEPYSSIRNVELKKHRSEMVREFLKENGIPCLITDGFTITRAVECPGSIICTKPLEFTFENDRNLFLLHFNEHFEKFTSKQHFYGSRTV